MEQSKAAYRADFASYGIAVMALATYLALEVPASRRLEMLAFVLGGLAAWTLLEYGLHRFVLHGVPPFSRWHGHHHQRPTALICTPTIVSATLIGGLFFLPALMWGGLWRACASTLGLVGGYLAYAATHHAIHYWRADGAWLRRRKRWHAVHHHATRPACYGVTSAFWDHVFGSVAQLRRT